MVQGVSFNDGFQSSVISGQYYYYQ